MRDELLGGEFLDPESQRDYGEPKEKTLSAEEMLYTDEEL